MNDRVYIAIDLKLQETHIKVKESLQNDDKK